MGYQSKTYSLSDEVIKAIDAAKAKGVTPNQLLRSALLIVPEVAQRKSMDVPMTSASDAKITQQHVPDWRANRKPLLKHKDKR